MQNMPLLDLYKHEKAKSWKLLLFFFTSLLILTMVVYSVAFAAEPQTLSNIDILKQYYYENPRLYKYLVILVIFLAIGGIYLGLTNKYIFYDNKLDIILSMMPWASIFLTYFLFSFLDFDNKLIYKLMIIIPIIFTVIVMLISYKHNNNIFIAFIITIGKILISMLVLLQIDRIASPAGSSRYDKRREVFFALVIFAILSALISRLTNGDEVRAITTDR